MNNATDPGRQWPEEAVTVVVPTRDSVLWIDYLVEAYRALGLPVLYCVDTRTSDATVDKLRAQAVPCREISTAFPSGDAMVSKFQEIVATPWILRMDDDEFPSLEMVRWIATHVGTLRCNTVGFPRRWVRFTKSRELEYLANRNWHREHPNGEDRQFRMFNKTTDIQYTSKLHTPGYKLGVWALSPIDCPLYHFDWVMKNFGQRLSKIPRYERLERGAGTKVWRFYLPEFTFSWDIRCLITDPNVVNLARNLANARVGLDARDWIKLALALIGVLIRRVVAFAYGTAKAAAKRIPGLRIALKYLRD